MHCEALKFIHLCLSRAQGTSPSFFREPEVCQWIGIHEVFNHTRRTVRMLVYYIYIYYIYIYLHTDCHCTRLTIDYMYITYYRFQDVIASIYLGCIMHHPISHLPANPGAGARSFAGVSISQLESETPSSRASESWKRK